MKLFAKRRFASSMGNLVVAGAALLAIVSARPYARSWNDGASLAMVEALVDHQTLAIDRSIFVEPARRSLGAPSPYRQEDTQLNAFGTLDKVYVDGRYYAAKPFVPGVLMAAEYWLVQRCTGLTAAASPRAFVYIMTLLTSGIAYVVAVGCIYELARRVLRSPTKAAALAASFALGTVALAYVQHVNGHLVQLAAMAGLCLLLHVYAERLQRDVSCSVAAMGVGSLLGLAYIFDQGVGPAILLGVGSVVLWRARQSRRGWTGLALVVFTALPWIVAQHGLNLEVGQTMAAVNSRPEHFAWPGSPWNRATMTGGYGHESAWKFATYSLQMLAGKKGFLLHNPLLLAAVVAWLWLIVRRGRSLVELPEIVGGLLVFAMSWGVYSWGSTNYSGMCISVRWLLPCLAPGYYALAIYVRERPQVWPEVLLFCAWSVPLGLIMAWCGPWYGHVVPGLWLLWGMTLASWIILVVRRGLERATSPAVSAMLNQ